MRRGKRILSEGTGVSREGCGLGTRSSTLPSNSESGIRNSELSVPPCTAKASIDYGSASSDRPRVDRLNEDQADQHHDPNDPAGQGHVTQDRAPAASSMAARSEASARTTQIVIGSTNPATIRASNTLEETGLRLIPPILSAGGRLSSRSA